MSYFPPVSIVPALAAGGAGSVFVGDHPFDRFLELAQAITGRDTR